MSTQKGFTLVELLVAMAISGIVMAGIYSVYYSQQKSYVAQEEVAEMQQNLRAAMFFMAKEIRMAGCNPTGQADTGFVTADSATISFTMDIRGQAVGSLSDGTINDPDEDITYSLSDWNGDGVMDLMRSTPEGGNRPVAENIETLNFVYLDANGDPGATPLQIRSVQITLVARTGRADPGYTDTTSYENLQGTEILAPPNDNFRRKRLATHIKCRNMGLL